MQVSGRGAAGNMEDGLLLPVRYRRVHAEARKRFIIRDAFQGWDGELRTKRSPLGLPEERL